MASLIYPNNRIRMRNSLTLQKRIIGTNNAIRYMKEYSTDELDNVGTFKTIRGTSKHTSLGIALNAPGGKNTIVASHNPIYADDISDIAGAGGYGKIVIINPSGMGDVITHLLFDSTSMTAKIYKGTTELIVVNVSKGQDSNSNNNAANVGANGVCTITYTTPLADILSMGFDVDIKHATYSPGVVDRSAFHGDEVSYRHGQGSNNTKLSNDDYVTDNVYRENQKRASLGAIYVEYSI